LEIVTMLRELTEQCFAKAPEPLGMPLTLSRCTLAGMLHNCAEMVSFGLAGERGVDAVQAMPVADVEVPATQTPPPPDPSPCVAFGLMLGSTADGGMRSTGFRWASIAGIVGLRCFTASDRTL